MNAVLKLETDQTPLARALSQRTENLGRDAALTAKDQQAIREIDAATRSAAALDALKARRTHALADVQVDGSTQADLPALEREIADAEAKHRPLADAAAVAVVVRERLAAQRIALRAELQAIEAELPALAHTQLRGALGASAPDVQTTMDFFLDELVNAFGHARACDLLAQRSPGSAPSASHRAIQLVIPLPEHPAFKTEQPPRNLTREIEDRAQVLLSELSA